MNKPINEPKEQCRPEHVSGIKKLNELVDRFNENIDSYRNNNYNETQVRREFIDPFFELLGWDVANRQGFSESYKDVVHEDAIKVGGATKAPDYSFRIGGTRKFFLEAKKPSVSIKGDPAPAYQLRRYAWSAKLSLSILTDFEEFAVYDCRNKPSLSDSPAVGRILYCSFDQYPEKWNEIYGIFSKEAVLKGSFDRYILDNKAKRGTEEVDSEFLKEIEGWRDILAKNIALRNSSLTISELNYSVQTTIDRIIFLRMAEDRSIESYGQLQSLINGENIYGRLLQLYYRADEKYNSGLFDFKSDKLSPALAIDDRVLKEIIDGLYYPKCPYEFSVLSADILGNVYEQFLGKVIRLTAGHQARVEEKPEVKKAGGVYYTPKYIVDYIVKNTVGKILEGKTPSVVGGDTHPRNLESILRKPIRILDPACGSGSFLLGAYQYLLDWHRDWYSNNNPEKWSKGKSPQLFQSQKGEWRLTTTEKKRILLSHIYGVDIDRQAVEVTKLSLLLKVLEGENKESLQAQLRLFHERALPNLENNIKCGNSLIGSDFYEGSQGSLFDEEERTKINPFDWNSEFPEVFFPHFTKGGREGISNSQGGFDVVIGNPPYVFTRDQSISSQEKRYYYALYENQGSQLNTFGLFLEKSFKILNTNGIFGFITPNNWLTIDSFRKLRKFYIEQKGALKIYNNLEKVFKSANVDTAIVFYQIGEKSNPLLGELSQGNEIFSKTIDSKILSNQNFILGISQLKDTGTLLIINKINKCGWLSQFVTVSTGIKVYQTGKGHPKQTDAEKKGRVFHSTKKINKTYKKYLNGKDVIRYSLDWSREYLSYGDWLAEPRKSVPFSKARILVRQIPASPPYCIHAVYTEEECLNDINSMVVFNIQSAYHYYYLLGILNSKLLSFWFQKSFDKLQRKIFPQFKVKELAKFPIRTINFDDPKGKFRHDLMVKLADEMLNLHKKLHTAKTPHDKELIERQIESTDLRIDRLVYELYGLTKEEIEIVEGVK